jgi:signal transduction histidine kinase
LGNLLAKLFPQPIKRRGILFESLIFVMLYIVFLGVITAESPVRPFIENLAILTASATAALLIFISIPGIPESMRRAWLVLGFAQLGWLAGAFLMDYVQPMIEGFTTFTTVANSINLAACFLAGYALFLFPFKTRHAPTRFRFVLDAIISCGVVATLGFLLLMPSLFGTGRIPFDALVVVSYPVADCLLLILLVNFSLANWVPRHTARFLGAAWTAFLISDYIHSSLVLIGNYRAGSFVSIGWVCGSLLIGLGAVFEKGTQIDDPVRGLPVKDPPARPSKTRLAASTPRFDLGVQFQKVLPIALVLVLVWYVLNDWRLNGRFSPIGLWMSAVLGVMVVVRLGIRAGEAELNQYWQLFKNLADPSFICDPTGKILLGNPACAALIRLSEERDLIGYSLFEIFEGLSSTDVGEAVKTDQILNASLKRSGTLYLVSLSPIITETRKVLIAGVAHDLSEQKQQRDAIQHAYNELQAVYKRLEDLNAQLEQKVEERTSTLQEAYRQLEEQNRVLQDLDQIKSDFVSMVSHELRAPLTNLGGGLELLLSREHDSGKQKTLVLIQAEIQRLTRFVENILNVSAMEAGKFVLHPIRLSLSAIVSEVRNSWQNLPEIGRIDVDIPKEMPFVFADETALRSVFAHLVDNALKYAPQSKVRICAQLEGDLVRVEVRDFGPGIPIDKQNLLFDRFQRLEAKDSQSVYGYGLGLYLSQRLLRAMESELHFESPKDGGARFYFHLSLRE